MIAKFPSRLLSAFFSVLLGAAVWAGAGPVHASDDPVTPKQVTPERKIELHGIAASCLAFYQAAMLELELPLDPYEDRRRAYLPIVDSLTDQLVEEAERKRWMDEHVMRRTSTVATLIQMRPDEVSPKVMENLDSCDTLLPEMKQAASSGG